MNMNDFLTDMEIHRNVQTVDLLCESQTKLRRIIKAEKLAKSLNGLDYILIGAHAVGAYIKDPRATGDVDIVINPKDYKEAVKRIKNDFKFAIMCSSGNRFVDENDNTLIDLIEAKNKIYQVALELKVKKGDFYLPTPEMLLVMKFLSSISPLRRPAKRNIDKGDFLNVLEDQNIEKVKAKGLLKKVDPEYELHVETFDSWLNEI